jgi:uncharacterized protein (DUF58 family)
MTSTRHLRATFGFALLSGVTSLSLLFAWIGNETLALVAGAGLALIILAPILAWLNLGGLHVRAPGELCAFAGLSCSLDLELERGGLLISRDLLVSVEDGRRLGASPTGHVPRLDPRRGLEVRCHPRFGERGRRNEVRVTVQSSFPLGLFSARREFLLDIDLLVLPRITRLGPLNQTLRRLAGPAEAAPRGARGQGEFHSLHEWRAGESLRGIAWKASARRGRLLARELVSEDKPDILVVLCTRVEGAGGDRRHPLFERAVQLAASLLDDLVRRGQRVTFTLDEPTSQPLLLHGRGDLRRALALLAEVEAIPGTPSVPRTDADRRIPIVILVGGGEQRQAPAAGLVIDVQASSGLTVLEAGLRKGLRRRRTEALG